MVRTSIPIATLNIPDTAKDKQEIQGIAAHLFELTGKRGKEAKVDTFTIEGDEEANDLFGSSGKQKFSMPLVLINTIDNAHLCCCPRCEPEAADLMMENARRMVREEQIDAIEEATRREMVVAIKKQYLAEAQA